jgi:type IV secretion system protein VirB10
VIFSGECGEVEGRDRPNTIRRGFTMRWLLIFFLASLLCLINAVAQTAETPKHETARSAGVASAPAASSVSDPNTVTIPAGTKIPLSLKQAISTKNAREGDSVYAETAFPYVVGDRVIVPAGSYVQGSISHVERAGRVKGRAEILMHFTSIIFPSGYTVMLPASVENTPGADDKSVKDSEGTIQQDKDTGKKIEEGAKGAVYGASGGALAGGLSSGVNGARVGAGAGAAAAVAWTMLKRGSDVKLDVGTSIEMEIQRPVMVDGSRIAVAKATP